MNTVPLKLIIKNNWILDRVKNSDVLHVGCTDWPLTEERINSNSLLHKMICDVSPRCIGIDLDNNGIECLKELMPGKELYAINAEEMADTDALANTKWDYIVAGDVVEHMDNPGKFFRSASKLLKPNGVLIITVPSAFSAKRFFYLLLTGREQVHPDHTAYFSVSNLQQIANRNGYKIESIHGFQWINPTFKNRLSNLLAKPFLWISRGRCADELAVEFRLSEAKS